MKFDQVSKDLLAGARFIERNGYNAAMNHPARAVAQAMRQHGGLRTSPQRMRFYAAHSRLCAACGLDNMDLSPEEAIDSLVAAAFWETP